MEKKSPMKQSKGMMFLAALFMFLLIFVFVVLSRYIAPTAPTAPTAPKSDPAIPSSPPQKSIKKPIQPETSLPESQHQATSLTTPSAEQTTQESLTQTNVTPETDYTYSSRILSNAVNGLKELNALHKSHANISEADIRAVWQQVDDAVDANYMSAVEGIKHKQWLASLVQSETLNQQLETDMQTVQQTLNAESAAYQKNKGTDSKFLAYKTEEQRLTAEILAKYPDDSVKAAAELNEALQKVRTEIYK